tara:strand:- start:8797 stop:9345 length:549 start_codon:yes stop_codon:yes gene_type:complete
MAEGLITSTGSGAGHCDPFEERLAGALPKLRSHLVKRVGARSSIDAEDVTQEVMTRAMRYRDTYDPARSMWPWLRRMAENVLVDQYARPRKDDQVLDEAEHAAPARTPSVDAREELERVLNLLRPIERDVLLRFHQQQHSVSDIARDLHMPLGTVKSHLSRARRRLAQLEFHDRSRKESDHA